MSKYIQRLVNLELHDFQLIRRVAVTRGLGGKGFSAALRMIIREWSNMRSAGAVPFIPPTIVDSTLHDPPSDSFASSED